MLKFGRKKKKEKEKKIIAYNVQKNLTMMDICEMHDRPEKHCALGCTIQFVVFKSILYVNFMMNKVGYPRSK